MESATHRRPRLTNWPKNRLYGSEWTKIWHVGSLGGRRKGLLFFSIQIFERTHTSWCPSFLHPRPPAWERHQALNRSPPRRKKRTSMDPFDGVNDYHRATSVNLPPMTSFASKQVAILLVDELAYVFLSFEFLLKIFLRKKKDIYQGIIISYFLNFLCAKLLELSMFDSLTFSQNMI
jgi:hypothetical protein